MSKTEIGIILTADGRLAQAGLAQVEQGLARMGTQGAQASKQLQQGIDRANNSLSDFVGHAARLTLVTQGISGIASALNALPKTAFDYTKNLETSAVGMAGIMASVTALNGKQLEYNQALGISQSMLRKLGDDALRTAASSQELVGAFQALLAPGLAAGMKLDEIRQLTTVGTNAVKSIGLQGTQVVQELRDLVAGGITASSSTLATALGLNDADIAKAKASAQGLFAFLMERLKGFEASSEAFGQTLQGRIDTLKEGVTRVAADGMKPLTDEISRTVGAMGQLLVTFDDAGKATINPELVNGLSGVSEGLVTAMNAGKATVGVLYEHRDAVGTLAAAYAALKLGSMVSDWTRATAAKIELMQASRLAAVQAAAEGASNTALTLTSRQKTAALLAELQANVQKTAAQAAATVGTAAAIQAEQAHTNAVRQLTVAQDAASVSGRAMSAVIGALGGPVGIAITALTGLAFWIGSVSQKAEAAANLALKYQRASGAAAQGKVAEAGDIAAMQAYANQLREVRDSSLQAGDAIRTFRNAKGDLTYAKGSQMDAMIAKVESDIKAVTTASEKAGEAQGQLTLTLAGAKQAWEKSLDGVKTASSVQDDYAQKLGASQRAYQEYRSVLVATGADQASISAAATKQAQTEKALVKERDAALKSLNKTTSNASAASRDYNRAVDAGLASLQTKVQAEAQYARQLAQYGLDAERLTEGEKEAAKIGYELAAATKAKGEATTKEGRAKLDARIATLQLHQAEAQRLADFQLQNRATKDALELGQKAINDLQKQADAIRDKTAALAEENAAYGQINPTLAKALAQGKDLASQMVMTDGSVMDYERAQRAAEAWALMNGYIGQLMQQDWNKINSAVQEWQRSATEQAALYEDEARLSGLTALERAKVVAASQVELKLKKQIAEIERAKFSEDPVKDAAQKAKLMADATTAAQTESSAAVAKVVQEDWTRTSEKIEEVLIDALMNGGKSGAEYIEGLFRSMVLRPVLQVIVSPVAEAVTSALGFGGGAAQGANALGAVSNFSSLYSTATGGLTASLGSAAASIGTAIGSSAVTAFGTGMQGSTLAAGLAGPTTAGATGAMGLGASVGAAMPWIGGALVVDQLLGGSITNTLGKVLGFGGDKTPRYRYQTGGGDFEDKVSVAGVYGNIGMNDNGSKNIKAADFTETFQAIADLDATIAATLSPDQNAQIKAALNNYVSGKNESTADYVAGRLRVVADTIGGGVDELVDQFGGTSEALVGYVLRLTQAQPTIDALRFLGHSLGDTEAATLSAALALEDLVGGQQNLLALTGSYYQNFYTEAERTEVATRQLTEALAEIGIDTLPATREAFRALVEAQDLTTESGRETYAALMGLNGAFAALVPAMQSASASADTIEQAYQRLTSVTFTAEQAAEQRIDLEKRLLTLQGNSTELRRRELQAIDASNRGLQRLVWALDDVQTASASVLDAERKLSDAQAQAQQQQYDTQYEAAKAIADAARTAADEMKSLADTLRDFVLGETLTPSELFADTLKKALGGDVEAMRALPQAATAQMDAARQSSSTQADYAIARAQTIKAINQAAAVAGQLGAATVTDPVRQIASVTESTPGKDPVQAALSELNIAIDILTMSIATAVGGDLADKLGKIDTNLDGSVSESEFKAAFNGTASDNVLSKIFNALDSDSSSLITRLEAIKTNTSGLANAIGSGTASQVISTPSGMDRASFESTLKSEAIANNVDLNNLTTQFSSFANGVFSSLDNDSNGFLTGSEVDSSKISGAVKTLIDTYTKPTSSTGTSNTSTAGNSSAYTPSSSDLSRYQSLIVGERPSGSSKKYEQFVYDLYIDYARRKPEISGFNYWVNTIKDGVKSYPESDVLAQVKKSFSAATQGITKEKAFDEQYNYLIGSSLSENAAKYFAGISSYAVGGYTGPGGKYEAAGVVHRGEVVFSQDDIARLGGVRAVEAIRTGEIPGYAQGGTVGAPVVVPAPVMPGRVAMAPRPAAITSDPEQQERDTQARDQAQREAQQQTQDLIAQLRQVNSNLTELKRSVDKSGQSNDQMNNKIFNMADTTVKLLRKFDALGMPVVQAATEAA